MTVGSIVAIGQRWSNLGPLVALRGGLRVSSGLCVVDRLPKSKR